MHNAENNFKVHILFRCSKKTGKIDTTMTGLGSALMRLWALSNTTPSKECLIFNREDGRLAFHIDGNKNGLPIFVKYTEEMSCEDFGISLEYLQSITDDRFDKED